MISKCEHELLCTEISDRKFGSFRYFRIQIPHDDTMEPRQWFDLMANIAEWIIVEMMDAGINVRNLKWQFMTPLTVIDAGGVYVNNPCSLLS